MGLVFLEDAQQLGHLGIAGSVKHRGLEVGHHGLPPVAGSVEVLAAEGLDVTVTRVEHRRVLEIQVRVLEEDGGE